MITIKFRAGSEGALSERVYSGTTFVIGDYDPGTRTFQERSHAFCRDIVANDYQKWACGEQYRDDSPFSENPFNRTTFAICCFNKMSDDVFKKRCKRILELLHPFEKELHWKRTKIFYGDDITTSFKQRKKDQLAFVLGSKCWVQNPIFIFPYLAVFKGFLYNLFNGNAHNQALRDTSSLQEYFEYLAKYNRQQYTHAYKWMDVIRDRRKLFKDFTRKDLSIIKHDNGLVEDVAYAVGIHRLLSNHFTLKSIKSSKTGVSLRERIEEWERNKK